MKERIIVIYIILLTLVNTVSIAAETQDNQGELQIYIFTDKGLPLKGAIINHKEKNYISNNAGFINFTDFPGQRTYSVLYEKNVVAEISVKIRQNMVHETLVTVSTVNELPVVVSDNEDPVPVVTNDRKEIDDTLSKGKLIGSVKHIETLEKISGVTIVFREVDLETVTDDAGNFSVDISEGTYSISLIHSDYSTRTIDEIVIKVGEEQSIDIMLTPSAITLDAINIFASNEVRVQGGVANLIEETKNSGVMLNLIGSEQMSKSGDSDAASALGRVTGLSIVDGRYVYVRGMGERYSGSYLNGARLPSPEIDKRVVPLDLFPTSVLESMAIQKTYSPDKYGDFAGGTVGLRTSGIPKDRYKRRLRAIFSSSIGYNVGSTFTEQMMDVAGKLDFLGIDDGHRGYPENLGSEEVTEGSIMNPGMTPQEINDIGKSMNPDWDGTTGVIPPDFSLSASIRNKVEFGKSQELGWNLSLLYKNAWDLSESSISNYSSVNPPQIYYDYNSVETNHDVDIGGLFDFEYKPNENLSIGSTTLLVRTTDNSVQNYEGYFASDDLIFSVTNVSWIESTLFSQRLGGDIRFDFLNDSELNWQYTFSRANRYEPGNTSIKYTRNNEGDPLELYFRSNAADITFVDVKDNIHDAGLQFEIPVFLFSSKTADYIELGGQVMVQDRTSDVRRFAYGPTGGGLDLTQNPDDLFVEDNIGNGLTFGEFTSPTDNYKGFHNIYAGYITTDIIMPFDIRFNGGVRAEYSDQRVETFNLFGGTQSEASLVKLDFLPSLNFTIPITDKMQVRIGGSRTVNRPDLRELSDAPKYGVAGSGTFTGNPDLKRAEIYNGDLRWEYYITEQENLSLGVFYKKFTDAIEVINLAGGGDPTTLGNVPSAYNLGFELEWRLSLRYISDGIRGYVIKNKPSPGVRKFLGNVSGVFRDLYTSGNLSFIKSEIDYQGDKGINTSETRGLQGQSPWIINASLGYKNSVSWSQESKSHTNVNLNYNVFGPRISRIGVNGTPDYFDQPYHQLDLITKHSFNEVFSVGFKFGNILDLPVIETVGDQEVNNRRKGRSFSLSVKFDI